MTRVILRVTCGLAAVALATACGGHSTSSTPAQAKVAATKGSSAGPSAPARPIGHFLARFDHASRKLTFERQDGPASPTDTRAPQFNVPISPSGGGPSQAANTVDLISTNCMDNVPTNFSCDVEVRSFFPRAITNVVARINAATFYPAGGSTTAYDSISSDTENPLELTVDHGLWVYQNGSTFSGSGTANGLASFLSANDGSNDGNGDGLNTATRTWVFANPDDQNVTYDISVFATDTVSGYLQYPKRITYVPVCPAAGGSGTALGATSQSGISLPFDFTIYRTNAKILNVAPNGQITFGTTPPTSGVTSIPLPNATAPGPAFFPFWDNLGASTSDPNAQICTETVGTAPNRQFVIEWYGFDFLNAPEGPNLGASLDFEVLLDEGTSEIDVLYNSMLGAGGVDTGAREQGSLATVGIQNETGTNATSEYHAADFGDANSGDRAAGGWSYLPAPCEPSIGAACASLLAGGQHEPSSIAADATNVYWVNNYDGTVMQLAAAGGAPVAIASGQGHPQSVAIDSARIYWSSGTGIFSVPIGGGAITTIASNQASPLGIASDGTNVYWANEGTYGAGFRDGAILEAPVTGGTPVVLAASQYAPSAVTVDATNIYWTNLGAPAVMQTSLTAGGALVTLASGATAGEPRGLAVNATSVYWTNYASAGSVLSVPIGGAGAVTTVVTGQQYPYGVALDSGSVYWTNDVNGAATATGPGSVMSAPLAGGSATALVTGQAGATAIAATASTYTTIYWASRGTTTVNGTVSNAFPN